MMDGAQGEMREAIVDFAAKLPDGWIRAWLRVELHSDGSGGSLSAFFGHPDQPGAAIHFMLPPSHLLRWEAVQRAQRMGSPGEPFTSVVLSLASSGRFDLRYGYEPLLEPPLVRQQRWMKEALDGYQVVYPLRVGTHSGG